MRQLSFNVVTARLLLVLISIIGAAALAHGKHWRRAPVHGTFDVDAYAYNKPVGKLLAGQEQTMPALPVGKLLQQLSQSSRASELAKPQYRQLDEVEEEEEEEDAEKDLVIAKRLAELARENLYSHEFLVLTKGKKKFVQLNTLSGPEAGEAHKPEAPQVMAEKQAQPLNVKLVLPALQQEEEKEEEQVKEEEQKKEQEEKQKEEQEEIQEEEQEEGQKEEKQMEEQKKEEEEEQDEKEEQQMEENEEQQKEEQGEEQVEQEQTTSEKQESNYTEAISTMQQMEAKLTSGQKQQHQQLNANADSRLGGGVKDAQNMTTIEEPNAANAAGRTKGQQGKGQEEQGQQQEEHVKEQQQEKDMEEQQKQEQERQEQQQQQQEQKPSHQISAAAADDDAADAADADAKQSDSRPDNDGQVNGMNVAPAEAVGVQPVGASVGAAVGAASSDKPLPAKMRRKQTQRQTQTKLKTKTKTRPANEIDTKPTSASSVGQRRVQGMPVASHAASITNVKAPAKESPEISQQDIRRPVQKVKGNGMDMMGVTKGQGTGKGKMKMKSKRKGTRGEQEIETTTNWWHILPYAEIRKFLNTIYDSITDEDDDERAQRI